MNNTTYQQWVAACIVLFSFARPAISEEIDQLTNRETIAGELSDASNNINIWTERQFTKILSDSQNKGGGCDRDALIEDLRLGFDTRLTPVYISLSKDSKVPKAYVPKNQSIYRDFGVTEVANTSPALRVGNTVVGLDKIDHFFGHGFGYWRYYEHQKREQDALDLGENQEQGTLGLGVAGVKSYSDLSANYAGLQFWKEILDGSNPYIVCKGKKWVRSARSFRIQDYSSAAWDEGINCNSYASADHLNKVLAVLNTTTHPLSR